MYTKIIAISLYLNEIEIGGPLFSKIYQMALKAWSKMHQIKKTDTTPKNQFFTINNFALIPTQDFFHSKGL